MVGTLTSGEWWLMIHMLASEEVTKQSSGEGMPCRWQTENTQPSPPTSTDPWRVTLGPCNTSHHQYTSPSPEHAIRDTLHKTTGKLKSHFSCHSESLSGTQGQGMTCRSHMQDLTHQVAHARPHTAGHTCRTSHSRSHMQDLTQQVTHTGPHTAGHTCRTSHSRSHMQDLTQQVTHAGPHTAGHTCRTSHSRSHMQDLTQQVTHAGPHTAGHTCRTSHSRSHMQDLTQQVTHAGPHTAGHTCRTLHSRYSATLHECL